MAWILSVVQQPPIHIIAALHIQANDSSFWIEVKLFGVVSKLSKKIWFFLGEPIFIGPARSEMIDSIITIWLCEIFNINWPSIMITLNWVDLNSWIGSEGFFQSLSNIDSIVCDFFIGIIPDIVCRVVTNPSDKVNLQLILILTNKVKHIFHSYMGNVTFIITPFLS